MVTLSQNIYENAIGGLDCIWIGSNIIEDKLCNRKFDCENCPLDKVMKNLFGDSDKMSNYKLRDFAFIDAIIHKIEETNYDSKLIYLKNNLVVKNIYANIYYLGINPLIANLFENLTQVREYMRRVYFVNDNKILSIDGEWGSISLTSSINFLLLDKLNWSPEAILTNKWIALVAVNQNELTDVKLSHNQFQLQQVKILNMLNEYRDCCLCIKSDLNDKGEQIKYFYQLIGKDEYINILNNTNIE
jgi:hypothetical protein